MEAREDLGAWGPGPMVGQGAVGGPGAGWAVVRGGRRLEGWGPVADSVGMMNENARDPQRRGLLMVVGGLSLVLVAGGVWAGRGLLVGGTEVPRPVAGTAAGGGAAGKIETALEAAQQYGREKKWAEANAILEKLAAQAPTDRAVRVAYAQALLGQEKHAEAYTQYEAAIALTPTKGISMADPGSAARAQRDPALAQLHFEAGTCASVSGKTDRAEEHYWMAQVLDPGEARYPLFLAMVQIRKGDDAAAAASLLRAVKINPELAEAWGTLAELEVKQNRLGLAAQHVETARRLQPGVTRWRVVEARTLVRQNEPEKAEALLSALPPGERMQRAVVDLRAEALGLMGKPAAAAQAFAEAAGATPSDADLAYRTAEWFRRAGNRTKAQEWAKRAGMLGDARGREMAAELGGGG